MRGEIPEVTKNPVGQVFCLSLLASRLGSQLRVVCNYFLKDFF